MSEIASLRPLGAVAVPALGIVAILASHRWPDVREGFTIATALATLGIVASMVPGAVQGSAYVSDLGTLVPGIEFVLRADPLGMIFGFLASFLWVITSFYSIGYMRGLDEHSQTRYFAAFAASISSALGVAFASNLLVLFVFYELLSVATYPLVAHDETEEARTAGRKYLAYTFGGGVSVLAGTAVVYWATGTVTFAAGGIASLASADPIVGRAAFALLIAGFGVKAALMPIHSWLPDAMVAPTPVSGLLHAVAVVKSGVFGIARVVLDVYGPGLVGDLGVGLPLAAIAGFTIITASVIALRQDNLKRRLAFSTISQLSYIVLGLALLSPAAIAGGLLHIPAHAFMKLTLFFAAGAIHVETHTDDISQMGGIGYRMPVTMAAFGIASVGMAGLPLVAGFVSKWYLLIGSLDAGTTIFALVLFTSGLLNIGYFWPIVYRAFFQSPDGADSTPLLEWPLGGTRPATDGGGNSERTAASESTYAVDENPSDVETTYGEEMADGARPEADLDADADASTNDDESEHDEHHGGPPAGGWDRRGFGEESTWFMLGPIAVAVGGAVALGVAPYSMVFLDLVRQVVVDVLGVAL